MIQFDLYNVFSNGLKPPSRESFGGLWMLFIHPARMVGNWSLRRMVVFLWIIDDVVLIVDPTNRVNEIRLEVLCESYLFKEDI